MHGEESPTFIALKRLRSVMNFLVLHKFSVAPNTLFTMATLKRSFSRVYLLMIKKKKLNFCLKISHICYTRRAFLHCEFYNEL